MTVPRTGRAADQLRPVTISTGVAAFAEGSAMIRFGQTEVRCTASIENRVPPFLVGRGQGWVTAEYAMLPRATFTRTPRESVAGQDRRTHARNSAADWSLITSRRRSQGARRADASRSTVTSSKQTPAHAVRPSLGDMSRSSWRCGRWSMVRICSVPRSAARSRR